MAHPSRFYKCTEIGTITKGNGNQALALYIQIVAGTFTATVLPTELITDTDRPDLTGPFDANGPVPTAPTFTHHVLTGSALTSGAVNKWDTTRQIRVKVLNPPLFTVQQLPAAGGDVWANQPVALDIPEDYPPDDTIGNDDAAVGDEDNDPYSAPIGLLRGRDAPRLGVPLDIGQANDTFERRLHFREFVRLQLGQTWYRASDFYPWRGHFRWWHDGTTWLDDNSFGAPDNNGF